MNKAVKRALKNNRGLPESLFPLFWEYDPIRIDLVKHAGLIIGRIMERGSWASMLWLQKTYSRDQLVSFLEKKGHRMLPPRELNYWALVSDVDPVKKSEWLKKVREKPDVWENRYSH
jgi:hypothetical protein